MNFKNYFDNYVCIKLLSQKMKTYYFTLITFLFALSVFSQTENKDHSNALKLVEVWLESQKDFDRLPGLTAVIVHDQDVIWSGGFGFANVDSKLKAKASTVCSICSISKLFTAVAIMKLYDEGKLRLDDEINDLLPNYQLKQNFEESGPVNVRTLLTHSSGLPREVDFPYWTGPDFSFPTKEEISEKLVGQNMLYPASTYLQYSNLGFAILGEIVEEISGISYEQYIQEHILKPLNLLRTQVSLQNQQYGTQLAIGYSAIARKGKREKMKAFQTKGMSPAAGFYSNVMDLAKFASWQFRLRDGSITDILKPATLKSMQRVHWNNPDWKSTWGLGFSVYQGKNGNTWVGHDGSCPGYNSTIRIDLNRELAFVVMINANGTVPRKYANGINSILSKVKPSFKESNANKLFDLSQYVGYYSQMPWWGEVYVSEWDGLLVSLSLPSEHPGNSMTFYKHIKDDTFRRIRNNGELGETRVFQRDKKGRIFSFKQHGNYSRKIINEK